MSNSLYVKFLMRKLIQCLEKKQEDEAKKFNLVNIGINSAFEVAITVKPICISLVNPL